MKKINFRMTMKRKLMAGFAGILAIFIAMALFNLNQVSQIKNQMELQNSKVDLKLKALELKEMVQELNIIASGLEISKKPEYIDKYNAKRQPFNELVKLIGDTASTPEERQWRSQLISSAGDYISNFDTAAKMIQDNKMNPTDLENNLVYLYNESQNLMNTIFGIVDQFYGVYAKDAQNAVDHTNRKLNGTSTIMLMAAVFVLLTTAAVAWLLNRSFMGPILKLQNAVSHIAAGDLRHKINSVSTDELGQLSRSFDRMIDQVRAMLGNTQKIASALSEHSDSFHRFSLTTAAVNSDILRAIEEISRGADLQASQAEKSSHIIGELEEEIAVMSRHADQMMEKSLEAAHNTERGTSAVQALQRAAAQTEQVIGQMFAAMQSLLENSGQIGKITNTITEISTQTHVLSLNAAIEAARAGVHGRGFSVIAEEVRKLAKETNQSSKVIQQIITALQQQMTELQSSMQAARSISSEQNAKMADTIAAFETISQSMAEMAQQISQIHNKLDEVKSKNEILVHSVQQVAAVAEETAAGVQEVGSTSAEHDASIRRIADESEDIRSLSQQLFAEISKFRIEDIGQQEERENILQEGTDNSVTPDSADVADPEEEHGALAEELPMAETKPESPDQKPEDASKTEEEKIPVLK
jgi:methyl-accepting chemotaxis protein